MPMFCFMELDLISLKVSAVSSSRFWVVYGFSLSWEVLVLAVLDMSISKGTSKRPYQHIFTVSSICQCFFSQVTPYTASQSLVGTGLCGSFLDISTFPSASWRLVWAFLSPLSSPSASQGLCALVLAHWAQPPLYHGSCIHLSLLKGPSLCILGLVYTCFG